LPARLPDSLPQAPTQPSPAPSPTCPCLAPQALSWLFAPILAGGFSFILFFVIRAVVLRSSNAYKRSLFLLPIFTFLTFYIVTWFIIAK